MEDRIKQQVYEKRIRITESFVDYDRLRKGIVIEDKVSIYFILLFTFLFIIYLKKIKNNELNIYYI